MENNQGIQSIVKCVHSYEKQVVLVTHDLLTLLNKFT